MKMNFEELENILKQGHLDECLVKLKEYSQNTNFRSLKNEILSEQSRLKKLNKQYHSGLITFETYGINEAKIRASIIDFIDEIKSGLQIVEKIQNENIEDDKFQNEEKLLEGVWICKHSSGSPNEVYFWSLLPDNLCIVNILNKKSGETQCKIFRWDYDKENRIIIQRSREGEVKGIVEWVSPLKFKLTILDIFKSVMIYEKIL